MHEAGPELPDDESGSSPSPPDGEEGGMGGGEGLSDDLSDELQGELPQQDKPVFPEELELAKLAIRALYFNTDSKDVHNLKLKVGGTTIPFEKVSDFFEKTKKIIPILSFVEWVMDKYEGLTSKWTEDPEVKGKSVAEKVKYYLALPDDKRLDNGKRVYWVRIILNALLHGSPDMNINIADVNEKNIVEVFRLLKQHFGRDTRGLVAPDIEQNLEGPGVF